LLANYNFVVATTLHLLSVNWKVSHYQNTTVLLCSIRF